MSTSKDISGHKICPLGAKLISSIRKFHFSSSANHLLLKLCTLAVSAVHIYMPAVR